MKSEVFHILLTLFDGESHGYAIMQHVAERTEGRVVLLPGALYRHLRRLLEAGAIEELDRRPRGGKSDERRRYYRVTRAGRKLAKAEAERLEDLVRAARARHLLGDERA